MRVLFTLEDSLLEEVDKQAALRGLSQESCIYECISYGIWTLKSHPIKSYDNRVSAGANAPAQADVSAMGNVPLEPEVSAEEKAPVEEKVPVEEKAPTKEKAPPQAEVPPVGDEERWILTPSKKRKRASWK